MFEIMRRMNENHALFILNSLYGLKGIFLLIYFTPNFLYVKFCSGIFLFTLSQFTSTRKKKKIPSQFFFLFSLFFLTKSSLKCSQTDDCVVLMRRSTERMNIFYVIKNAFYTFVFGKREIW